MRDIAIAFNKMDCHKWIATISCVIQHSAATLSFFCLLHAPDYNDKIKLQSRSIEPDLTSQLSPRWPLPPHSAHIMLPVPPQPTR